MDTPTIIRLAQATGVIAAAFNSGMGFAISATGIPSMLKAPSGLMAQQWHTTYKIGKKLGPLNAVISCASFSYLAYAVPRLRTNYITAALLPLGIMPFTMLVILPTNDKIMNRAQAASKLKAGEEATEVGMPPGESTPELIAKWRDLNFVRVLISMAGAVYGAWTIMS